MNKVLGAGAGSIPPRPCLHNQRHEVVKQAEFIRHLKIRVLDSISYCMQVYDTAGLCLGAQALNEAAPSEDPGAPSLIFVMFAGARDFQISHAQSRRLEATFQVRDPKLRVNSITPPGRGIMADPLPRCEEWGALEVCLNGRVQGQDVGMQFEHVIRCP